MTFAELIGKLGYVWGIFILMVIAGGLLGAARKWIKEQCANDS